MFLADESGEDCIIKQGSRAGNYFHVWNKFVCDLCTAGWRVCVHALLIQFSTCLFLRMLWLTKGDIHFRIRCINKRGHFYATYAMKPAASPCLCRRLSLVILSLKIPWVLTQNLPCDLKWCECHLSEQQDEMLLVVSQELGLMLCLLQTAKHNSSPMWEKF